MSSMGLLLNSCAPGTMANYGEALNRANNSFSERYGTTLTGAAASAAARDEPTSVRIAELMVTSTESGSLNINDTVYTLDGGQEICKVKFTRRVGTDDDVRWSADLTGGKKSGSVNLPNGSFKTLNLDEYSYQPASDTIVASSEGSAIARSDEDYIRQYWSGKWADKNTFVTHFKSLHPMIVDPDKWIVPGPGKIVWQKSSGYGFGSKHLPDRTMIIFPIRIIGNNVSCTEERLKKWVKEKYKIDI